MKLSKTIVDNSSRLTPACGKQASWNVRREISVLAHDLRSVVIRFGEFRYLVIWHDLSTIRLQLCFSENEEAMLSYPSALQDLLFSSLSLNYTSCLSGQPVKYDPSFFSCLAAHVR
jgi:hypothetical protein